MTQVAQDPGRADLTTFLAPFWSPAKVRAELDVDEDRLDALAAAGLVLALQGADGGSIYPVEQFERVDGAVRV